MKKTIIKILSIFAALACVINMSCNINHTNDVTNQAKTSQTISISPQKYIISKSDSIISNKINFLLNISNNCNTTKFVKEISTLCNCIHITNKIDSISPNDSIELKGYIDTSNIKGYINKSIFISTTDGEKVIIRIQGDI